MISRGICTAPRMETRKKLAARQFEHNWQFNWCKNGRGKYRMEKSHKTTENYQVSPLLIEIRVEIMVNLTF